VIGEAAGRLWISDALNNRIVGLPSP
jgi:hypothetical protein